MNITNADYFTFNAHNSTLLIGQTGSGKTYMVRKLVERYMKGYKPDELKFAFFDLKQVEFMDFTEEKEKQSYLLINKIADESAKSSSMVGLDGIEPSTKWL